MRVDQEGHVMLDLSGMVKIKSLTKWVIVNNNIAYTYLERKPKCADYCSCMVLCEWNEIIRKHEICETETETESIICNLWKKKAFKLPQQEQVDQTSVQ